MASPGPLALAIDARLGELEALLEEREAQAPDEK
jgi:hypothetical protein